MKKGETEVRYEIIIAALEKIGIKLYFVQSTPTFIDGLGWCKPLLLVDKEPGGPSGFHIDCKIDPAKNAHLQQIERRSEMDVLNNLWISLQTHKLVLEKIVLGNFVTESYLFDGTTFNLVTND